MSDNDFSGIFAPLYKCPNHGEVWHVETVEEIDTINDDVYYFEVCSQCGHAVTPITHEGAPVVHPLTNEEAFWELGESDDESDYIDL